MGLFSFMNEPIKSEYFPRESFSLMHAEAFLRFGACATNEAGFPLPSGPQGARPLAARLNFIRINFTRRWAVLLYK